MPVREAIGELITGARLFLRGAMGTDAYQKYLLHIARREPETTPMTEREFWREKTDRQDQHPEGRCC